MRPLHIIAVVLSLLVSACGGGNAITPSVGSWTPPGAAWDPNREKNGFSQPIQFVLRYLPESLPGYPQGRLVLSPPPGEPAIYEGTLLGVELVLFGETVQRLEEPNGLWGEQQLSYVFKVPESFHSGLSPCTSDPSVSYLLLGDPSHQWWFVPLELCPGVAAEMQKST